MKKELGNFTVRTETGDYTISCEVRELSDREKLAETHKIALNMSAIGSNLTNEGGKILKTALTKVGVIYDGCEGQVSKKTDERIFELVELLNQLADEQKKFAIAKAQQMITLGSLCNKDTTNLEEVCDRLTNSYGLDEKHSTPKSFWKILQQARKRFFQ